MWKIERDGSCWMFSKNEELKETKQTSWCYFLLRPVLDGEYLLCLFKFHAVNPFASEAVYTRNFFSDCMLDSVLFFES